MGSGRYWPGNHCLRQAMRMTTSPNLVAQVQTTFTERTMMKKGQRSALGHCIEGALGRASQQGMNDEVNLIDQEDRRRCGP